MSRSLMRKLDLNPDTLGEIEKNVPPLDIEGVDMDISLKDIIQFIHESRKL